MPFIDRVKNLVYIAIFSAKEAGSLHMKYPFWRPNAVIEVTSTYSSGNGKTVSPALQKAMRYL